MLKPKAFTGFVHQNFVILSSKLQDKISLSFFYQYPNLIHFIMAAPSGKRKENFSKGSAPTFN